MLLLACAAVRTAAAATAEVKTEKELGQARPIFPFTAIVGQDEMKLALILNVIDPKIGGVMIMGDRGTGKSTTIRALADLLPEMKVRAPCALGAPPSLLSSLSLAWRTPHRHGRTARSAVFSTCMRCERHAADRGACMHAASLRPSRAIPTTAHGAWIVQAECTRMAWAPSTAGPCQQPCTSTVQPAPCMLPPPPATLLLHVLWGRLCTIPCPAACGPSIATCALPPVHPLGVSLLAPASAAAACGLPVQHETTRALRRRRASMLSFVSCILPRCRLVQVVEGDPFNSHPEDPELMSEEVSPAGRPARQHGVV